MIEAELRALLAHHDSHTETLEGGEVIKPATADGVCSLCFTSATLVEGIRGLLHSLDALRAEQQGKYHGRS